MKVLLVTGDDYAALEFENTYSNTEVRDIIADPNAFKDNVGYDDDDPDSPRWTLSVMEFGDIDPEFVEFIRTEIQDYDLSKDTNFYLETDILG